MAVGKPVHLRWTREEEFTWAIGNAVYHAVGQRLRSMPMQLAWPA
jgi:CO/xanthine dehydrogenase Mo-binding subunit